MARPATKQTAMESRRAFLLRTVVLAGSLSWGDFGARAQAPVTIFAAASTAGAMEAVIKGFGALNDAPVRSVYAASSILARQIAQGAPADIFLSANVAWMDELEVANGLHPGSRVDLLSNKLVLIAPSTQNFTLSIEPGFALAVALGSGRLALGDPSHVPAGIYAKAALDRLGVWEALAPKLAYANDVRGALALVARGEAVAGIVYASDAINEPRVRVVDAFPSESDAPIVYPLAMVRGRAGPRVAAFHSYLQSAAAGEIFRTHGFDPKVGGR